MKIIPPPHTPFKKQKDRFSSLQQTNYGKQASFNQFETILRRINSPLTR